MARRNSANSLISLEQGGGEAARRAQVLTVYLTRVAAPGEAMGLCVSFFFDARDGEWPFLVARDLFVRPGDKLDAILDSHFPEAPADPLFSSPELKQLVHLVVNALLYATSLPLPLPVWESGLWPTRRDERATKLRLRPDFGGISKTLAM